MLGIGIGKILLTLAVAAAAWYLYRQVGRSGAGAARPAAPPPRANQPPPAPPPAAAVEELRPCPMCAAYVAATPAGCGRPDCPYAQR